MASSITNNPALNLITAARDTGASPASASAPSTFSDVLERNMRQNDQAMARPREATVTPPRPAPTEQARPAPAQGSSAKPATETPGPAPSRNKSTTEQATAAPGTQGKTDEAASAAAAAADAASDGTVADTATSSPRDDATRPAVPTEATDALLTGAPVPDPAQDETAVAASLAALAPVLAGVAIPPDPATETTPAEHPATPARTLASVLMARLFGHPTAPATATATAKDGEGGTEGSGSSAAKLAMAPNASGTTSIATAGTTDAETTFAALLGSKQAAATPTTAPTATATATATTTAATATANAATRATAELATAPGSGTADTGTDLSTLVANKQPASSAPAATIARLATESGIDPAAARAPNMPTPLAAEPGAAGLLHTASATGVGPARAEPGPLQQLHVATAVGQRAWAEDVGTKLTWMVGRGESRAELVLTPPNMGKLGVSIHINGDQTTAHFVAATPAAREALEQAMPRLREMLQQSGINLGQADVSTSGQHQAREEAAAHRSLYPRGVAGTTGRDDVPLPLSSSAPWTRGSTGVIDTFA
jgi:flagellar hook-length control protein FliK